MDPGLGVLRPGHYGHMRAGEVHRCSWHDLHHPQLLADPPPPAVLTPLAVTTGGAQLGAEQGLGAAPPTAPPPGPVRGRGPAWTEPARALLSLRRAAQAQSRVRASKNIVLFENYVTSRTSKFECMGLLGWGIYCEIYSWFIIFYL